MLILYHVFVVVIFCWKPFHPEVPSVYNSFAKRSGANVRFEHMTVLILHQWNRKWSLKYNYLRNGSWLALRGRKVWQTEMNTWKFKSTNSFNFWCHLHRCLFVCLLADFFSKFISVCSLTWKIKDTVETNLLEKKRRPICAPKHN